MTSSTMDTKIPKMKKESEIRNDFFRTLNTNFKLDAEEENVILDLNLKITNYFKRDEGDVSSSSQNSNEQSEEISQAAKSDLTMKIEDLIKNLSKKKRNLSELNEEIEQSFEKLKTILSSRNELSGILKEFNNSTKAIMNEKEKIQKLTQSIEKIYKLYEETVSIQAFFDNTNEDCVEKIRFISDYEEIENGINFFTLNQSYVEASAYLSKYILLKRIAITRYYTYIFNSVLNSKSEGLPAQDAFLQTIRRYAPAIVDQKYYNCPPNYGKMKVLLEFFEKKALYDSEIKKASEQLKQKYIEKRIALLRPYCEKVFSEITNAIENDNSGLSSLNTNISASHIQFQFCEIFKMTLSEIFYFSHLFETRIRDCIYILQTFTSDIYENFYNKIRPIIVSVESLDDLISLFDGISDNFGIFFIDVDIDSNCNCNCNDNQMKTSSSEISSKVLSFFEHLPPHDELKEHDIQILDKNILQIFEFIKISKKLIRPTILKLVQDIQEKIFFKITLHLKNNFVDLESDFPLLSQIEEKLYTQFIHFPLFHFFLRRLAIIFEILKSKLDKQVLNEILVFSIEKFIIILNQEILNKKNKLTFDFEIYIIQQILLCVKIIEDFKVEAIETGIEFDFYFVTEMFRSNYRSIFEGQFTIGEMLANSAPKVYDMTRDFKKILYNNLLKSYKVFINLVNEMVFGRNVMEVVIKIRNREPIDEKLLDKNIRGEKVVFEGLVANFEKIITEIKTQIRLIDEKISEKIASTVIENISNIIALVKNELAKIGSNEFDEIKNILQSNFNSLILGKIKDSIFIGI